MKKKPPPMPTLPDQTLLKRADVGGGSQLIRVRNQTGWAVSLLVAGFLALGACEDSGSRSLESRTADNEAAEQPTLSTLQRQYESLKRQLARQVPSGAYIVVDTARNHLYIKRGKEVLLDAVASTGSGVILDKPDHPGSQWLFDTPRGEFAVQTRLTNPVWIKPDWAFLEEDQDIPSNPADRMEPGVLGDYALGFGKGYFIHGTLYTRLLGKNVTHGCIRLADDDLRTTYKLAKIGTPVMIF
jgi:L,D-transpeptidase YbiS